EVICGAPAPDLEFSVASNARRLSHTDLSNFLFPLRCAYRHQGFPTDNSPKYPFRERVAVISVQIELVNEACSEYSVDHHYIGIPGAMQCIYRFREQPVTKAGNNIVIAAAETVQISRAYNKIPALTHLGQEPRYCLGVAVPIRT